MAIALACDVADPAQCQAIVDRTVEHFGRLDVLMNNAGIGFMTKPFLKFDPADWAKVIAVNLSGAFYCFGGCPTHGGRTSDTAAVCAWLAGEEAVYVNGEAINVSGGEEMH